MAHFNRRAVNQPKIESMAHFNRRILAQPKMGFFNLRSDEAHGYPRFSSFEHREAYIRKIMLSSRELLDRINLIVFTDKQAREAAEERDAAERKEHSPGLRHAHDIMRFEALMKAATERFQQEQDNLIAPAIKYFPFEEKFPQTLTDKGGTLLNDGKKPLEQENEAREASASQEVSSRNLHRKSITEDNLIDPRDGQPVSPDSLIPRLSIRHDFFNSNPSTSTKIPSTTFLLVSGQQAAHERSPPSTPPRRGSSRMSLQLSKHEIHHNPYMDLLLISSSNPQMKQRPSKTPLLELADHLNLVETVFVGDKTTQFVPIRGDLIVVHPERGRAMISTGHVVSYEGPNTHEFEHGELVVRIGLYEEEKQGVFIHHPYENLELYMYNREGDWKYLGGQVRMLNTEIAIDSSPGKYLQVGSPVLSSGQLGYLVPRRGDVIIKRAAWMENFAHRENFRRSMIKWHRNVQIQWAPDDLLLRLFVEKDVNTDQYIYSESEPVPAPGPRDHSNCRSHGPCTIAHTPPVPGFAELYRFEGSEVATMGWVFWGRTKHIYDRPHPKGRPLYLLLYVSDDGRDSDLEDEKSEPQVSD